MNILLVHPHDLFDKSEPWTIRVLSLAKEFAKQGHCVKICYFPVLLNHKHQQLSINRVDCIPLDRAPTIPAFIKNTRFIVALGKWADIIHFQKCHYYAALPAVIAAYLDKKPLHYDWDDWEEKIWYESCGKSFSSRIVGFSFKLLERLLPVLSDSVSCASNCLKELAMKFKVKEEFIFDAPVGADLNQFNSDLNVNKLREKYQLTHNEQVVLYIGQLHGAQYVDLLIKAANIVLLKRPDVKFMIVGEGFLEKQLRQSVADLGLEEKIIFTGAVSHDEIPAYISLASVCTAPFKNTEVTRCKSPLKIVEYMASSKAIVASNVGEVTKMLGGVGVLTIPGDHHDLARGIFVLLEDSQLRKDLGLAARRRAENKYNWSYTAENLLRAYNTIINQ
ncbi:MAG TPA: glycosyltransferase family 4 protein [Candidatus Omnitrophota bacterium]|nr:glycosyltransferase family 4 protein [Candidatus Omnitrophota bacterium]HPT39226.1 glycosyltransferase family 4 protein [Candidatus Omnitrophota bacterium]